MKKILVPTDFSTSSLHALDYAIMIANKANASITLMWINNFNEHDSILNMPHNQIEEEVTNRFATILKDYSGKLLNGKMEYVVKEGRVYKEVSKYAEKENIDLVICGSHGSSGYEGNLAGSNAFRIITYCKCPVITIRHNFDWNKASNIIVMPIDSTDITRQKVETTCEMAEILGNSIHILGLYSSSLSSIRRKVDNHLKHVEKYIQKKGINYVKIVDDADNITRTTINYAEKVNADLIAIMTEQEKTAYNLLLGPYAQQMINTSLIPVISISPSYITTAQI